ncbi:MAG: hypothetical protein RQ767_06695 [Thermovirgaceae bacterium]|nr:hypothetical protein [Thermovirgaceae bacterium]
MLIASLVLAVVPATVSAAKPQKENPFICPSVSLNNPNAMWVLGHSGAYFVMIPMKGGIHADEMGEDARVYVSIPEKPIHKAQHAAKYGLFKDYPSYPNFYGDDMIMLLEEGLHWLGSPDGWMEGDILMIMEDGTVSNMGPMMNPGDKGSITIEGSIPISAAIFW